MRMLTALRQSSHTLRRKLLGYMLLLALILILALLAGMFLSGRINSAQKEMAETLSLQMEVFEKDMTSYWEEAAVMGVHLSESMTEILEGYMNAWDLDFSDLTDNETDLNQLQQAMLEPLCHSLHQTSCSGAFVMLEATVNSGLKTSEFSRNGLYVQNNWIGPAEVELLLYRGNSTIGKQNGVMLHRKWQLEFHTGEFPNYSEHFSRAALPLEDSYRITELFTIPGTSEQAVLMTVPMIGRDGTVYGLCGFEVSQSYFKMLHAQPSNLRQMVCLLVPGSGESLSADAGLSCGISQGYYFQPQGVLQTEEKSDGLWSFTGASDSYIGVSKTISLTPDGDDYTLAVMIPRQDLNRAVLKSNLQMFLLILLLLFFGGVCCVYLSRRFLSPLLKDLEQIKTGNRSGINSNLSEIDDLFAYLDHQDQAHEEMLEHLTQEALCNCRILCPNAFPHRLHYLRGGKHNHHR